MPDRSVILTYVRYQLALNERRKRFAREMMPHLLPRTEFLLIGLLANRLVMETEEHGYAPIKALVQEIAPEWASDSRAHALVNRLVKYGFATLDGGGAARDRRMTRLVATAKIYEAITRLATPLS